MIAMILSNICTILFCLLIVTLFILNLLNKYSNIKWFCTKFDCHKKPKYFIGIKGKYYGVCPRCGKTIQ